MKLPGYYSSGQFARMANVSVRTIRFYDKQNILKPSYVTPAGARFYTDSDFARLQQILLLKYLGFSLDDIREMTIDDSDYLFLLNSLNLQKKLIQDQIEQMQLVESAIEDTVRVIEKEHQIDWSQMLDLIHLTNMEKSLKSQYQNASNISSRIRLHKEYSTNSNLSILLSDVSDGMLRDARRNLPSGDKRFSFACFDCHSFPSSLSAFDLIIANHVLFYCNDLPKVFKQIQRALKKGGLFLCSTYGKHHMVEISELVQEFDSRIVLSAEKLYEQFGLENGEALLKPYFSDVQCIRYEDSIELDRAEPLIEYILSCHGNQNQMLLERYHEFRSFVEKKTANGFHITKDAGIFLCTF